MSDYLIAGLIGFCAGFFVMWVIARIASYNLTQEMRKISDSLLRMSRWRNDLLASMKEREGRA
ncbi:unnamed protein product [marine sediment metagenome]|uniref:Uncharacterized protein n=1 Tax=marine sediment metagenome TaxID=412755 RepID=X0ZKG6_9ZZZZ